MTPEEEEELKRRVLNVLRVQRDIIIVLAFFAVLIFGLGIYIWIGALTNNPNTGSTAYNDIQSSLGPMIDPYNMSLNYETQANISATMTQNDMQILGTDLTSLSSMATNSTPNLFKSEA